MTLLAYDPNRVATLRSLVLTALAELDAIGQPDPIAAVAVRNARRSLRDGCLPALQRIVQCTALGDPGWSWDVGPALVVSATGTAVDIGAWATELTERWTVAAQDQALGAPGATIALRAVADELRLLGSLVAGEANPDAIDRLLAAMPPVAAAHVLGGLRLGDRELAERGYDLLRRDYDAIDDATSSFLLPGLSNTADILAALVVHRPGAARRWTELVTADPYVLYRAADRGLEQQVLLLGTRPGVADADAALGTISAIAEHLHHGAFIDRPLLGDRVAPTWQDFLGELAAPWLAHLAGAPDRTPWADAEQRRRTLADICRSAGAVGQLEHALQQQLDVTVAHGLVRADGVVDQATVQRLAAETTELNMAIESAHVDRATGRRAIADTGTTAVVTAVTGPLSATATAVVAAGSARAVEWLTDRGWYPRSADDTRALEREHTASAITDTQLVTVVTVAAGLVEAGELPASFLDELHVAPTDACRADDVDDHLRRQVLAVQPKHPRAADALLSTIGAFSNRASVSLLCD